MSLLKKLFTGNKEPQAKKQSSPVSKRNIASVDRTIEALKQENERLRQENEQRDREFSAQMEEVIAADEEYKKGGDIAKAISVYEKYYSGFSSPQCNSVTRCLRLAELYVKAGKNDVAWGYLNQMYLKSFEPGRNWDVYRIRFAQFKILKGEKRHKDAFWTLVSSYVLRSDDLPQPYFSKNTFLKDAKTTAKGIGLSDEELSSFTDGLERKIMNRALHDADVPKYCADWLARLGK